MSPAISTTTVTVNAAFLQEIKQVNEELWQTLREVRKKAELNVLERPDAWRFLHQLGQLRDQLAFHFTLEEAYGYFEDPAYAAPRLCVRADQLRNEHPSLYLRISRLFERAEGLQYEGRLCEKFATLACELVAFDDQLHEHENRENELILAMYDDDIGVGD